MALTRMRSRSRSRSRARRSRPSEAFVRLMVLLLLGVVVVSAGWLWFRESSFARVEQVEITGLHSSERDDVRAALRRAALDMTTLHVREQALQAAVAPFESVATVHASGDFPHTLAIEVAERRAVAVMSSGGTEVLVAADGRLLRGVEPQGALPELEAGRSVTSDRLTDRRTLGAVAVLAAAPRALQARVQNARRGERGLTLELRAGPDLIFGDGSRVRAKWAAAARVLAEPSAVGAVYLDLRLPERVAAGGVAPTPDPSSSTTPVPPEVAPAPVQPTPTPAAPAAPAATPVPPAATEVPAAPRRAPTSPESST